VASATVGVTVEVGGQILDTAIGLTFIFVALSLVCSFIQEIIATAFSWRSQFLERGLRSMLEPEPAGEGAADGDGLADRVMASAFIREKLSAKARLRGRRVPSYLSSRTFALALLDTIAPPATGGTGLLEKAKDGLTTVLPEGSGVRRQLEVLLDDAGDNLDRFRGSLEDWYDDTMDRVSGWYKRRSQVVLLIIGIAVAGVANTDTVEVTTRLWKEDAVRAGIVAEASQAVEAGSPEELQRELEERGSVIDGVKQLDLPIGWNEANGQPKDLDIADGDDSTLAWLAGVLITGVALSFGAPFWFDALSKLSRLRISGKKPQEA
jgi:hypothetical protein